ncbi:MAG: peptide chain release factor N(5)-glutamine methyltransferase [Gammaproteobacteria bacterium]|nr:peptide chain release factor N(5)-glutamine methyltransferase [Gammaproteobacteria bacterium]
MSTSIQQALLAATQQLADQHDTASLDAELLLAHVLHKSRTWLYTWPEQQLDTKQIEQFNQLVQRRLNGEPVAHLLGTQEFWSLSLQVTADTLIPRPETERLVELALERIPTKATWRIADLGTGSGAIALAVAKERPTCQIIATDQSMVALQVAKENARLNQINNVIFLHGDWLAALKDEPPFDMILSNPPYIKEDDEHLQQGDVRFEPDSALQAGVEGLDDLQQIIEHALSHLKPGGWLLLEHGYDQEAPIIRLLQQAGYEQIEDYLDLAGQPRVAAGSKPL